MTVDLRGTCCNLNRQERWWNSMLDANIEHCDHLVDALSIINAIARLLNNVFMQVPTRCLKCCILFEVPIPMLISSPMYSYPDIILILWYFPIVVFSRWGVCPSHRLCHLLYDSSTRILVLQLATFRLCQHPPICLNHRILTYQMGSGFRSVSWLIRYLPTSSNSATESTVMTHYRIACWEYFWSIFLSPKTVEGGLRVLESWECLVILETFYDTSVRLISWPYL